MARTKETSTNEAQSPPNPQKRISGKQRKATLEEYQQTFLQVPRIDDRKPVFVSSDVLNTKADKHLAPVIEKKFDTSKLYSYMSVDMLRFFWR